MEKNLKNQKLTIIVGALLLVIGVSFSYFLATTLIKGNGSSVVGTTARIKGAEVRVEGTLEFNDTDVLPGHKNVSAIKVTATGNNELIPYNLVWKGESEISQINYTVYKSSTSKTLSANCERKTGVQNGMQVLSEECTITNIDTLGEAIASGSISIGDTKEILVQDEFITANSDGQTVYYYVVLEYPNLDEDQSSDANATFQGEVTVEESNKQADINILAVYVADENGNYTETSDIPQSGYELNTSKSTCSNNSLPIWDSENNGVTVSNLTKSGTNCYLYFDIYHPKASDIILASLTARDIIPDFSQVATTDEGIYVTYDNLYGGQSYYWRGAVTNNYVKFAGFCWRISRINGDKTIRLIYDGESCHANGVNTAESIAVTRQKYNVNYNKSEYVGYTYTVGSQRGTTEESNLKAQSESWFNTNITGTNADKVATGKFCNDRNTASGFTWSSQPSSIFYYAARGRLESAKIPTLSCANSGDVYNLKVGAITADEVAFAGGVYGTENNSYYLYNGQHYWTMTPYRWTGTGAILFYVASSGNFNNSYAGDSNINIRPVINLRSDIAISNGDGTLNNPYIVQ